MTAVDRRARRRAPWSRSSASGSSAQMLFLARSPRTAPRSLLYQRVPHATLASATASRRPDAPVGDPVALLTIPRIGSPAGGGRGHRVRRHAGRAGAPRETVLPGQAGTSVVYGRAATYGAPFRDLGRAAAPATTSAWSWRRAGSTSRSSASGAPATRSRSRWPTGARPADAGHGRRATGRSPPSPGLGGLRRRRRAKKGFPPPSGLPATVPDPEQAMRSDHGASRSWRCTWRCSWR